MAYQLRHAEWIGMSPGRGVSVPEDLLCADYALLADDHQWLEAEDAEDASIVFAGETFPSFGLGYCLLYVIRSPGGISMFFVKSGS